jgi:hypothetical protein
MSCGRSSTAPLVRTLRRFHSFAVQLEDHLAPFPTVSRSGVHPSEPFEFSGGIDRSRRVGPGNSTPSLSQIRT